MVDHRDELLAIAAECEAIAEQAKTPPLDSIAKRLDDAIARIGRSHSGSWLGYQSRLYYRGFEPPPADDWFESSYGYGSDSWREYSAEEIYEAMMRFAGAPDKTLIERASQAAAKKFQQNHDALLAIVSILVEQSKSSVLEEIRDDVRKLKLFTAAQIISSAAPSQIASADRAAWAEGRTTPPHVTLFAWLTSLRLVFDRTAKLGTLARRTLGYLERATPTRRSSGHRVFIGHGRSLAWRDLRDFLERRLSLQTEEFNSEAVAGRTITDRIDEMLDRCTFAFLVMTGEDEHADSSVHARSNVIHEFGRAQQKLGSKRAIVLLEEGCSMISNLQGLVYVPFAKGLIRAAFEDIREVLEREQIITP